MQSNRRDFLKNTGLVAVTFTVPQWLWACGGKSGGEAKAGASVAKNDAWEAQAKKLEDVEVLTMAAPGAWAGKEGSHIPVVTFNAGQGSVTLETKHEMSEEHWITLHYLRNQDGVIVGLKDYAGTDPEAKHTFTLPEGTTTITAYSHCNKHSHWSADQSSVG